MSGSGSALSGAVPLLTQPKEVVDSEEWAYYFINKDAPRR